MDHDEALLVDVLHDLKREPMAVYEVLYAANELLPDQPVSERLAVAERVFARLVSDGSVRLWRGQWIGPEFDRTPVPDRDIPQILRSWSTWSPEDEVVWMELRLGHGDA